MPLSIEENLSKGNNILISQIKQHKQTLLNYSAICGLTIPTKYIELIDSHVIKLTGNSLEPETTTLKWKHYEGTRLIAVPNGKKVLGLDNPQPSS